LRDDRAVPRLLIASLTAFVACSGMLAGCSEKTCNNRAYPGLDVTVVDAGGTAVCGATVTATDGAYTETLRASVGSPCHYEGAVERTGVYTVTATFDGLTVTTPDVTVGHDECHVVTKIITVMLPAAAPAD
jgi:hypothetical protein